MAGDFRDDFEKQIRSASDIEDGGVRAALLEFADALDEECQHDRVPKPKPSGGVEYKQPANSTAGLYLKSLRVLHERGLELLAADAQTVNDFMADLASDPERRRTELVDYDGSLARSSCQTYQAALRGFYRFCTEPGAADNRPGVEVEWPAEEIVMFRDDSNPKHDEDDMADPEDVDAMREACVKSQNTRRDRAFVELVTGTAQRVYALVTLRIKHVNLDDDDDVPHILLNPEIRNDGDKGAIENTGRFKPIVTDMRPIQDWIEHHPLQDPETREEWGAPDSFEDCYLFIGDPGQVQSDLSGHWDPGAANSMLKRRKEDTADISTVKTVEIPANPHNWRHFAYTQSQDLPIDESKRRKVFGWAPGSTTGQDIYGHKENEEAGRDFAEAWQEEFDGVDPDAIGSVAISDLAGSDLSPEARAALVDTITSDDELKEAIASEVAAILEG